MKVLNLQCEAQHGFEGWFASEDDFSAQRAAGQLACPVCGVCEVHKLPSAPRLNLNASRQMPQPSAEAQTAVNETPVAAQAAPVQQQAAWLQMARRLMAQTEDVGERFAEEARKIHYGETQERGIRGKASRQEAESLLDEGIAVLPLLLPEGLDGPLH